MKVGIVSRRIREEKGKRIFKKPQVYKLSNELFSAEIPYSLDEIKRLSERKLEKVVKRAKTVLSRMGIDKIIYSKEIRKTSFDVSEVFYKFAPMATRLAARRFDLKELFPLCVRQENPDNRALSVIKSMIYDAADIKILTDKPQKGGKIQKGIIEEFGAAVELLPYDFVSSEGITVNLDKNEICVFGKWVLRDFEIEAETFGYDVCGIELFALQNGDFEKTVIKSCRCGKNKLTLNEI